MSDIFVGIAVVPAGLEEYSLSVSLISTSSWQGPPTTIGTKTFTSPVKSSALTETVRSLIFSISPELTTSTIVAYLTSVPPALPADQLYKICQAVENAELLDDPGNRMPSIPCHHGEAYTIRLPKEIKRTTALLALDLSIPGHLCTASLNSAVYDMGYRSNFDTHDFSVPVSFQDKSSLETALKTILGSPVGRRKTIEHIVLIMPHTTPEIDIRVLVANIWPGVPVSIPTPDEIAEAAVSFLHADLRCRPHVNGCYWGHLSIPVSVATASGTIVPLANKSQSYQGEFFVILTNSVTNQKSASVRLLIGNHSQAKDNIQRAVVVLEGLHSVQKGHAKICVSIDMSWRWDHARVVVQQRGGPKKSFFFPHFFSDLPDDHDDDKRSRRYDMRVKSEKEMEFSPDYGMPELDWEHEVFGIGLWSHQIMGTLPE